MPSRPCIPVATQPHHLHFCHTKKRMPAPSGRAGGASLHPALLLPTCAIGVPFRHALCGGCMPVVIQQWSKSSATDPLLIANGSRSSHRPWPKHTAMYGWNRMQAAPAEGAAGCRPGHSWSLRDAAWANLQHSQKHLAEACVRHLAQTPWHSVAGQARGTDTDPPHPTNLGSLKQNFPKITEKPISK